MLPLTSKHLLFLFSLAVLLAVAFIPKSSLSGLKISRADLNGRKIVVSKPVKIPKDLNLSKPIKPIKPPRPIPPPVSLSLDVPSSTLPDSNTEISATADGSGKGYIVIKVDKKKLKTCRGTFPLTCTAYGSFKEGEHKVLAKACIQRPKSCVKSEATFTAELPKKETSSKHHHTFRNYPSPASARKYSMIAKMYSHILPLLYGSR